MLSWLTAVQRQYTRWMGALLESMNLLVRHCPNLEVT